MVVGFVGFFCFFFLKGSKFNTVRIKSCILVLEECTILETVDCFQINLQWLCIPPIFMITSKKGKKSRTKAAKSKSKISQEMPK